MEKLVFDSGDYESLLNKALVHFKWDELQAEVDRRIVQAESSSDAVLGVFVEESGKGPVDGARITIDTNGDVEVLTEEEPLSVRDLRQLWPKLQQQRWVQTIVKSLSFTGKLIVFRMG